MLIALIVVVVLVGGLVGVYLYYGAEFKKRLLAHPTFSSMHREKYAEVSFQYASPEDDNLKELRELYDLDTIAGDGPEIEKIINLMRWVSDLATHHHNPTFPKEINARNLIRLCHKEKKKLNCFMFSVILNEVYLAKGFKSRRVHLLPITFEPPESHFVVAVYPQSLDRWVMMDPDFGAYLMNEDGEILGLAEIRRRLVSGEPMVVSDGIKGIIKFLGKDRYLWYLSKNMLRFSSPQNSAFNDVSIKSGKVYYELLPDGYHEERLETPRTTERGNTIIYINDQDIFWQKP
jgi:hypothetical protein